MAASRHEGRRGSTVTGAPAADDHHPAVAGQDLQVTAQVDVGQHFQDDVHAAVLRKFHGFLQITLLAVVQDVMRPLLDG